MTDWKTVQQPTLLPEITMQRLREIATHLGISQPAAFSVVVEDYHRRNKVPSSPQA